MSSKAMLTPNTRKVHEAARVQQKKALDALLMPPPPPPPPPQPATTRAPKSSECPSFPAAAGNKENRSSSSAAAAAAAHQRQPPANNSRSPATPRPVGKSQAFMAVQSNQLSRTAKPKPFQQKLSEAAFTPPKTTAKCVPSGAAEANTVTSEENSLWRLQNSLKLEREKNADLLAQLDSRNQFISRIEKVAQAAADELAKTRKIVEEQAKMLKIYELSSIEFDAFFETINHKNRAQCAHQGGVCAGDFHDQTLQEDNQLALDLSFTEGGGDNDMLIEGIAEMSIKE
ncbi:hypothetical protein HDU83_005186 [Entophlyctis luteolus]|nr:hypothetical protein HDU83_005186 [Entophlyctis luteolus]